MTALAIIYLVLSLFAILGALLEPNANRQVAPFCMAASVPVGIALAIVALAA